jgi:hypothetical protein
MVSNDGTWYVRHKNFKYAYQVPNYVQFIVLFTVKLRW